MNIAAIKAPQLDYQLPAPAQVKKTDWKEGDLAATATGVPVKLTAEQAELKNIAAQPAQREIDLNAVGTLQLPVEPQSTTPPKTPRPRSRRGSFLKKPGELVPEPEVEANPAQQELVVDPELQDQAVQQQAADEQASLGRTAPPGKQLELRLPEGVQEEFARKKATKYGKRVFGTMELLDPQTHTYDTRKAAKSAINIPGAKPVRIGNKHYIAAPFVPPTPPDPTEGMNVEERRTFSHATTLMGKVERGELTPKQINGAYQWARNKYKAHREFPHENLTPVLTKLGRALAEQVTLEPQVAATEEQTGTPPLPPELQQTDNAPAAPAPSSVQAQAETQQTPDVSTPKAEPKKAPPKAHDNTSPELERQTTQGDSKFDEDVDAAVADLANDTSTMKQTEPAGGQTPPPKKRRDQRDMRRTRDEFEKLTLAMIRKTGLEWHAIKYKLKPKSTEAEAYFQKNYGKAVQDMDWPTVLKRVMRTHMNLLRMQLQFTMRPVEQVEDILKSMRRMSPEDQASLLSSHDVMHGRVDEAWRNFKRDTAEPLTQAMADEKVTYKELNDYLNALHAPWRNKWILNKLKRNANSQEQEEAWVREWTQGNTGPSGLTDEQAQDMLNELSAIPGKMESLRRLDSRIREMTQMQRDLYRDGGLVPDSILDKWETTSGVDAFTETRPADMTEDQWVNAKFHATYVPLENTQGKSYTELLADQMSLETQTTIDVIGNEVMSTMGRRVPALNILATLEENIHMAHVRKERAHVLNTLWEIADANPNRYLWEVAEGGDPLNTIQPGIDETTGMDAPVQETPVEVAEDAKFRRKAKEESIVSSSKASRAGERAGLVKTFQVKAPDGTVRVIHTYWAPLSLALSEAETTRTRSSVMRGLGFVNRILSAVNTTLAPGFMLTNPIRDYMTAKIHLKEEGYEAMADKVNVKTWMAARRGYSAWMHGTPRDQLAPADQQWYDAAENFRKEGGHTAMFKMEDAITRANEIKRDLETAKRGGDAKSIKNLGHRIYEFMDMHNNILENTVRLAAYKAAVDSNTLNSLEAATMAKNLTVNFGRRGYHGVTANSLFLFFNASMQGNARILSAMARSKKVRKAAGTLAAAGFMNGLIQSVLAPDDDDGRNMYSTLPEHVRERNMILWIPGTDDYIKIPLPYGFNAIWGLGDSVAEAMLGDYTNAERAQVMMRPWTWALNAFNPIGSSTFWRTITPTIAEPAFDIANNTNFFGSPINPSTNPFATLPVPDAYNVLDPDEQKTWQAIAQTMNSVSGGNPVVGGAIDVSPGTLKYLVEYYTGSMGSTALRMVDVMTHSLSREPTETLARTPVLRRLYGQSRDFNHRERYYQLREQLTAVDKLRDYYRGIKKEDPDAYREYMQANNIMWDTRVMQSWESAERSINRLTRKRNKLRRIQGKTDTHRSMMDNYDNLISKQMVRFNTLYYERIVKGDLK